MKYPNYRTPKNVIQLTYPVDKDTINCLVKMHKNELVGYRANMVIKYTKTSAKTWLSSHGILHLIMKKSL